MSESGTAVAVYSPPDLPPTSAAGYVDFGNYLPPGSQVDLTGMQTYDSGGSGFTSRLSSEGHGPSGPAMDAYSVTSTKENRRIKFRFEWRETGGCGGYPDTQPDLPPKYLYVRMSYSLSIQAMAKVSTLDQSSASQAGITVTDNGVSLNLQSPEVYAPAAYEFSNSYAYSDSFSHLYIIPFESGVAERVVTVAAKTSASGSLGSEAGSVSFARITAAVDQRSLSISATIDPTYRRELVNGVPARVLNEPSVQNEMWIGKGDTYLPKDGTLGVTYSSYPTGSWSGEGEFHWWSPLTGRWDKGAYTMTPPAFSVPYSGPVAGGVIDGVHHRVIDAADASHAEAYYNLRFHERYEDWVRQTTVAYPKPYAESSLGWQGIASFGNSTTVPQSFTLGIEQEITRTMTGTIGVEAGLEEIAAFKVREQIEVGKSVTVKTSASFQFTCPAQSTVRVYAAIGWDDRTGTCSAWGPSGYQNEATWEGTFVNGLLHYEVVEVL